MSLKRIPRMAGWLLTALLLIIAIALISPQQLPVALYKLSLISLAAVVAYWLDRSLFPYARPDSYLKHDWRCNGTRCEMDADHQADGFPLTSQRTVVNVQCFLQAIPVNQ